MNPYVKSLAAAAALYAATLLPAYAELDAIQLKKTIETSIANDYPKLDALYKDIHAHPELGFQEGRPRPSWPPRCGRSASR